MKKIIVSQFLIASFAALAAPANPLLSVPKLAKMKEEAQQREAKAQGDQSARPPGQPYPAIPPVSPQMQGGFPSGSGVPLVAPPPPPSLSLEEREMLRTLTVVAIIDGDVVLKSLVAPAGLADAAAYNAPIVAPAAQNSPVATAASPQNRSATPASPAQQNLSPLAQIQQASQQANASQSNPAPVPVSASSQTFYLKAGEPGFLGTLPVQVQVKSGSVYLRLNRAIKQGEIVFVGGVGGSQMSASAYNAATAIPVDAQIQQRLDPRRATSSGATGGSAGAAAPAAQQQGVR